MSTRVRCGSCVSNRVALFVENNRDIHTCPATNGVDTHRFSAKALGYEHEGALRFMCLKLGCVCLWRIIETFPAPNGVDTHLLY